MATNNLWEAAGDGQLEAVQQAITAGGYTAMSADENGYTPIHAAAAWGHMDMLDWLLAQPGADPCVRDSDGDTPLHHLAVAELPKEKCTQVANRLLQAGAAWDHKNNEGHTPQEAAVEMAAGGEGDGGQTGFEHFLEVAVELGAPVVKLPEPEPMELD
mmetsp:Transcript_42486/g.92718  ORF Transcript_42486/g.92718 Transcript_42486/m.92718 type:complete len:158 (+) Transcript_42486:34-507(+)